METALNKVETSRGSHEQRYAMFEFAFMPLALACADSQERFDELFPRSTIGLFLRTFFGLGLGENGVSVPKWKFIQTNLEHSSQVCYESFHVELIKALSVILTRAQDLDRLLACLHPREQYCHQIIAFLKEFAKRAVDSATREWACYALTLLCLKIVDFASGRIGAAVEGQLGGHLRMEELVAEAERCAGWVLPLILQHSHELTQEDLVGRTVSNLIKFFESRGREPGPAEPVRVSFTSALDVEGRERQRPELCSLVIQNAKVLYPYHLDLRSRLYELIRTSDRAQSPANVERIIKAAATVVNWCQRSANEGQQRDQGESRKSLGDGKGKKHHCRLISGQLMDLVRISMNPTQNQHARSLPAIEREQLLTEVLQVMKTIFLVHPVGALDPPEEGRQVLAESRDTPLALRLYELNASYLMVRFGRVDQDPAMLAHVLSTLQHVRSGEAKCLMLALKLLELLI